MTHAAFSVVFALAFVGLCAVIAITSLVAAVAVSLLASIVAKCVQGLKS